MSTFEDNAGNIWELEVSIRTARDIKRKVRTRTGDPVDLMELIYGELMFPFLSDAIMLSEILWVVVEAQAAKKNIKQDSFFAALAGDVLKHATDALEDAVADFFTSSQREIFLQYAEKVRTIQAESWEANLRQMQRRAEGMRKTHLPGKEEKNSGRTSSEPSPSSPPEATS